MTWKPSRQPARRTRSPSWSNRSRAKAACIRQQRNSCRDCAASAMRRESCFCWMKSSPAGAGQEKSCPSCTTISSRTSFRWPRRSAAECRSVQSVRRKKSLLHLPSVRTAAPSAGIRSAARRLLQK